MAEDFMVQAPPEGGAAHLGNEIWEKMLNFSQLLQDEGNLRGLIGPRELGKLWDRHLLNSLAIEQFVLPDSHVIDVGSGAGFPGIVLAIVRPDASITLIESMERRTQWLKFVQENLDLHNVRIIRSRAENMHGSIHADHVTARAVAALKKLVPWTLPLVKPGGSLLALKGERAGVEIREASRELTKYEVLWADVHRVHIWGTQEETSVVELRKRSNNN